MSAILSSNVTYNILSKEIGESGYRKFRMTVAFGNGALTYPTGGIPLLAGSMGCPNQIREVNIYSPSISDGYNYKYDVANNKILMFNSAGGSHTHDLIIKGGQAASTTNDVATYAGPVLGKEEAADATILGANSAASGGIVSTTIATGPATEVANTVAPAATTLYLEVTGW